MTLGSLDGEMRARAFALDEEGRNARREAGAGCRGGGGIWGEGRKEGSSFLFPCRFLLAHTHTHTPDNTH